MYFGYGTWYAEPTNLATTTPLLFFTRWITHFCAPVFVFLSGLSAFLYSAKQPNVNRVAWYLLRRGLWLVIVELTIINFAWTFDITFSFHILQIIWAIGISMIVLSAFVFLPIKAIFAIGMILVFGHNLLDRIEFHGTSIPDFIWSALHEPRVFFLGTTTVSLVYPVLPWVGLMALGYVTGISYAKDFSAETRRRWLLVIGAFAVSLFFVLRGFNLYGEPRAWREQSSMIFAIISFLNTTKYPPSLHFLLMTMGPALIFLSVIDSVRSRIIKTLVVFGSVPFFFYVVHLYLIHALALLGLIFKGRSWNEYILSARAITSGRLSDFGFGLEAVYLIWIFVIVLLYPICRCYQRYRENHPSKWWLSYL